MMISDSAFIPILLMDGNLSVNNIELTSNVSIITISVCVLIVIISIYLRIKANK